MHLNRLNKLVRILKRTPPVLMLPRLNKDLPLHAISIGDAGEPQDDAIFRGKWHGSYCVGISNRVAEESPYNPLEHPKNQRPFCPIIWHSGLTRRVANASFDGEALISVEASDAGLAVQAHLEEVECGVRQTLLDRRMTGAGYLERRRPTNDAMDIVTLDLDCDANDVVTAARSIVPLRGFSKRRKGDMYDLRELLELRYLRRINKIKGKTNPLDAGTKRLAWECPTMTRLLHLQHGRYTADYGS